MVEKNPEMLHEETTGEKVFSLKKSIEWDIKKFENYLKDKDINNSINKIFNKCCHNVFESERKNLENVDISNTTNEALKKFPDLWFYVTWTLRLPLWHTKFSALTNEQKFNYMALNKALRNKSIKK